MLNVYHDRGIIKWAAFDALSGFNSMLKEMRRRLGKVNKPILSVDDFEILNRQLHEALLDNLEIEITYYENGYSKTSFGKIKKLDYNNKMIILTTLEKISAYDILMIDLV